MDTIDLDHHIHHLYDSMQQMVDKRVEDILEKRNLAGKAWVIAEINKNKAHWQQVYEEALVDKVYDGLNHAVAEPTGRKGCEWEEWEENSLRAELNLLFVNVAQRLKRTPAGIKARAYKLLKDSYGKI